VFVHLCANGRVGRYDGVSVSTCVCVRMCVGLRAGMCVYVYVCVCVSV